MEKSDADTVENKTTHYVVYVYVDYRKEIGQRMLKSYSSKDGAIAYAKSLTTDHLPVGSKRKAENEAKADEEDEEQDGSYDEDKYQDHEIQYTCLCGRVFDAYLAEEGKSEIYKGHPNLKQEFINRVGVDEVEHIA